MAEVSVARLRIKAPPGRIGETRMRSEDALRLAAPEDERLLVLRRLDLGAMPARAPPAQWEARAAARLREQRARAVHARQPGAADADAVWFRSAGEARALLLEWLAAGRAPTAWFWRLAVPGWRGLSPAQWMAGEVARAVARPEEMAALARGIVAAVAAGHVARLLLWLEQAQTPPPAAPLRLSPRVPASRATSVPPCAPADAPAQRARRLFARLDAVAAAEIARALAAGRGSEAAREWLVRLALVAAAPELAAAPETVAQMTRALRAAIAAEAEAPPVPAGEAPGRRQAAPDPIPASAAIATAPAIATRARPLRREARSPPMAPAPVGSAPVLAPVAPDPGLPDSREIASAGAGVLLLIRPLWRIDIESWLAARPDLAAAGFGRALLAHIARRMRVAPGDPLFAMLGDYDADVDAALLGAWRIGLDRWLRRTAHCRLADVACRRGWLIARDEGLDARFLPDSADIRLRRLALDLDPGWVNWLGMVVRYHYRDGPVA